MLKGVKIAMGRFGVHSFAFAEHIVQKLATLSIGALFVSRPGQKLRRHLNRWRKLPALGDLKIAIVAHAYYPDLIPEILACRAVLPGFVPVYLTIPEDRLELAKKMLVGETGVTVRAVGNRGRDVAPFLAVLSAGDLDGYDAVLKLHTKRSPHLLDGEIRRKLIYLMLCGEKSTTLRALSAFRDPATGMVGWASIYRTAPAYLMANEQRMRGIAARMQADGPLQLGFFEGSMFWFRPEAFAPLRRIGLKTDDFEPEKGQVDGTLHHTIERCFTISTWASGMTVRDLQGRCLKGRQIIRSRAKSS